MEILNSVEQTIEINKEELENYKESINEKFFVVDQPPKRMRCTIPTLTRGSSLGEIVTEITEYNSVITVKNNRIKIFFRKGGVLKRYQIFIPYNSNKKKYFKGVVREFYK